MLKVAMMKKAIKEEAKEGKKGETKAHEAKESKAYEKAEHKKPSIVIAIGLKKKGK